ncbi:hypothetical protein GWI33_007183, partial [Rhynchophorus ferrugineus]
MTMSTYGKSVQANDILQELLERRCPVDGSLGIPLAVRTNATAALLVALQSYVAWISIRKASTGPREK